MIPPNAHTSYLFQAVYIDKKYTYLFYLYIFIILLFGDWCEFACFACKLLGRLSHPLPLFSFE